MKRKKWDAICKRCGLCCYQKEFRSGRMTINTSRPCAYLVVETGLCMVYEKRFKVCPDCKKVTLFRAMFSSLLPAECAYVNRYRKLKALIPTARVVGRKPRGSYFP
jgi:hypothetical protein